MIWGSATCPREGARASQGPLLLIKDPSPPLYEVRICTDTSYVVRSTQYLGNEKDRDARGRQYSTCTCCLARSTARIPGIGNTPRIQLLAFPGRALTGPCS
jgi:hypothetical protein